MEVIFPSQRFKDPDPTEDENDLIVKDLKRDEEEDALEDFNQHPQRRDRGRPKILRTGLRGRPKRQYHEANCYEEIDEASNLTEISLNDAIHGPHAEEWYKAIVSEMKSIIKNNTWNIVDRPEDHKVIGSPEKLSWEISINMTGLWIEERLVSLQKDTVKGLASILMKHLHQLHALVQSEQ